MDNVSPPLDVQFLKIPAEERHNHPSLARFGENMTDIITQKLRLPRVAPHRKAEKISAGEGRREEERYWLLPRCS